MKTLPHNTPIRRLFVAAAATLALAALAPGAAFAASGGDNNKGDFWVDTVGESPGPGHEMDPHLPCANINLWGDKMADAGGGYKINGWSPSGDKELAYSSQWAYGGGKGGDQVMDVIDVSTLIANAVVNGDAPVNEQGFHFKVALSQDPHKFKTFWVRCSIPAPPGGGSQDGPGGDSPDSPGSSSGIPSAPTVDTPSAGTPQQLIAGVRVAGGKKAAKRAHRKHHKRVHHRKHHKAVSQKRLPAFTG
jgi:hypothetical protein